MTIPMPSKRTRGTNLSKTRILSKKTRHSRRARRSVRTLRRRGIGGSSAGEVPPTLLEQAKWWINHYIDANQSLLINDTTLGKYKRGGETIYSWAQTLYALLHSLLRLVDLGPWLGITLDTPTVFARGRSVNDMPEKLKEKGFKLINNLTAGVAVKYFEDEAAVEGVAIFECGGGGVKLIYCIRVTGTSGALNNKPYVLQLDCGKTMLDKGKIMYGDIHSSEEFNTKIETCHKAMCTLVDVPYESGKHKKIVFSSGFGQKKPGYFSGVDLTQLGVVLTQPQEAEYEFNALKMVFSDSANITSVHMGSTTTQINSSNSSRQLGSGLPGYTLSCETPIQCDKIILTSTCAAIGTQFGWAFMTRNAADSRQSYKLGQIIKMVVEKFKHSKIGGAQYP